MGPVYAAGTAAVPGSLLGIRRFSRGPRYYIPQLCRCERFGQAIEGALSFLLNCGFVCSGTCHDDYGQVGIESVYPSQDILAAQPGHQLIDQNYIDFLLAAAELLESFLSRFGADDRPSRLRKNAGTGRSHMPVIINYKDLDHSQRKTPRISQLFKHVGTALQSRPAQAIIGLKIRTGLETRPHMFYNLSIQPL